MALNKLKSKICQIELDYKAKMPPSHIKKFERAINTVKSRIKKQEKKIHENNFSSDELDDMESKTEYIEQWLAGIDRILQKQ